MNDRGLSPSPTGRRGKPLPLPGMRRHAWQDSRPPWLDPTRSAITTPSLGPPPNGHVERPGSEREPAVRSNVRFAAEAVQDFSITVAPTGRSYRGDRSQPHGARAATNAREVLVGPDGRHPQEPFLEARPAASWTERRTQDLPVLGLHGSAASLHAIK